MIRWDLNMFYKVSRLRQCQSDKIQRQGGGGNEGGYGVSNEAVLPQPRANPRIRLIPMD